ncbi:MAG: C40 family peptidase, partial [Lysobacterales bacterium]
KNLRLNSNYNAGIALATLVVSMLLQGCATIAAPGVTGIRALPQARIELDAPDFQASPGLVATPPLTGLFSRSSRVLGDVLQSALSFTGIRYRYGGASPLTGFDCSGFVGYVFRESAGLKLPRASYQMASVDGRKLSREELKAGDLVFFAQRKRVNHVGIYLGDGRFIHAPSTGGRVRTDELSNNYWRKRFVNGKRVLDPTQLAGAHRVAATALFAPPPTQAGGSETTVGLFGGAGGGAR